MGVQLSPITLTLFDPELRRVLMYVLVALALAAIGRVVVAALTAMWELELFDRKLRQQGIQHEKTLATFSDFTAALHTPVPEVPDPAPEELAPWPIAGKCPPDQAPPADPLKAQIGAMLDELTEPELSPAERELIANFRAQLVGIQQPNRAAA